MTNIRKATGASFPYEDRTICYFTLENGEPVPLHLAAERKLAFLRASKGEAAIYAVWPGRHRSDLFVIDDLAPLGIAWKVQLEALSAIRVSVARQWLAEGKSLSDVAELLAVPQSTVIEALA